ncbi:MAG: PQQ-like beta-propeller repeat protein [Bacteroidota bacterium]|nr:PQQ-like beta-propeller repeat protein [Bacteroidota bacterium]
MKFSPKIPLLLLLITATATTRAQTFGGNPPSIKWHQVNTPAAKVIFPNGLDSMAIRVANIVQQMNGLIQPTIGYKQKQVSIVLQNQTTIANAYVGLAPFRSEFYLTPEQNSFDVGSLPWNEQLAIHEFRHVQQYNNFNVGLSHLLKVVFGEGGQALGNALSVPDWFFEGDAVFNETHVSEQGRGRLPFFYNGFRALWADGANYGYMKIRNGSYRDYTPDWYPLGYMMVSYGREKYGDDFWKNVTHDAAAYKGGFYPLQRAIKKYTGVDFETFRNNGMDHFKQVFKNDGHAPEQKSKHFDADREYPAYVNDSTMIYMKTTYDHLPAFVIKTGNKEKMLSVRDVSIDNYFAYHDGKIIYSSFRPDARWGYRDYSELVVLDIKTGDEQRLTRKTKYFSPSFSDDGKTIVTVEESTTGKSDIHLLSAADGKQLSIVPNKQHLYFTYPKFYGDDQLISAVRNSRGKMSLAIIDIKTGDAKFLQPFSYRPIVFPTVKNDTVYFSATSGINDRLFALSIKSGKLYKLSDFNKNGSIGNYQAAISNNKFAWVGFTAFGYRVNEADKKDLKWEELSTNAVPGGLPDFNISALKRDSSTDVLKDVKNAPLEVTKYPKLYHPLNFHSLIPNFSDPNYQISIAGENVLNTLQTNISFNYNRDEGYKQFGVDAIYGAWFPYVYGGANYTIDRKGYYKGSNIYWNETQVDAGLEVPLDFSAGKHLTGLSFGSGLVYSQTNFQQPYQATFADRSYVYNSSFISFSNKTQQARKNIYPSFGQRISLAYKTAISGLSANQFLASGTFYFPGLFTNHGFAISAAHQQKDKNNAISFSNDFPFSRGYEAENLHNMNKIGANYQFPIAYPDAGFANTFYLQRIRGNAFYDFTRVTDYYVDGSQFKATFRSTGAEVYFDTKFFNQASISFGFRYSYLIDQDIFGGTGHNRFELIVPVTIF